MSLRPNGDGVIYVYDDVETNESFERKCKRIRRNDPTIRTVDAVSNTFDRFIWFGYGRPLGKALLSNTVVDRIDLSLDLFHASQQLDEAGLEREEAPMLQYLRTSKTLRTVRIDSDCGDEEFVEWWDTGEEDPDYRLLGKILLSIAQNPSITTFASSRELPFNEFAQFLTSPATKVRTIRLEHFAMSHFRDTALLADAFAVNRSICNLFMNCLGDPHVEQVVRRLDEECSHCSSSTPRPITKVTAVVSETMSLETLLSSALVLQTLVLEKMTFDGQHAKQLFAALSSNKSVTKLCLRKCDFPEHAAADIFDLVQPMVRRGASNLRALQLMRETLGGVSSLHSVELEGNRSVAGFIYMMAEYDSIGSIGVKSLTLNMEKPSASDLEALRLYLSRTSALRDLRLGWSRRGTISRQLSLAFRANGSLVQVLMERSPVVHARMMELESYCSRNANLPLILAGYRDGGSCAERESEPLSLVPSLFVAAQQATRIAASTMLTGLLALSDSVADGRADALRMRG
jgi:hypothetical protein